MRHSYADFRDGRLRRGTLGEVHEILLDAIDDAGFEGNLVSDAYAVGIIQKRIIQNLYENPIVVCDVSGKNPNVMFELGLRLAFDKPVIIVKDDKTAYSFDTAPIEHLEYPRDLRFAKIVTFKEKLAEKIQHTHARATTDPDFTTFLKHFGEFKVAKIDKKEVSGQEVILDELRDLRQSISRLEKQGAVSPSGTRIAGGSTRFNHCLVGHPEDAAKKALAQALSVPGVETAELSPFGKNHFHVIAHLKADADRRSVVAALQSQLPKAKRGATALVKQPKKSSQPLRPWTGHVRGVDDWIISRNDDQIRNIVIPPAPKIPVTQILQKSYPPNQ
jgi:hypothetical protein